MTLPLFRGTSFWAMSSSSELQLLALSPAGAPERTCHAGATSAACAQFGGQHGEGSSVGCSALVCDSGVPLKLICTAISFSSYYPFFVLPLVDDGPAYLALHIRILPSVNWKTFPGSSAWKTLSSILSWVQPLENLVVDPILGPQPEDGPGHVVTSGSASCPSQ